MAASAGRSAEELLSDTEALATRLLSLHARVDQAAAEIERAHADRLNCGRGCSACCVDDIEVFEIEADRIRHRYGALLAEEAPHPSGACAFLDSDGACRIYESRPYVCRTQGLPLRFFHEDDEGEIHERRDICELNLAGPALTRLAERDCWTLGPVELELGQLQEDADGGERRRVPLRDLFQRDPSAS